MGPHVDATRPEIEILLGCARSRLDRQHAARIARVLERDIDWTYLVRTALVHQLSPLLAHHLQNSDFAVPVDVRTALRLHLEDNRQRTAALIAVLFELMDAFAQCHIAAIPFKGPTLGAVAYGDPALRRAGDLDFLIREEQASAVGDILLARGFMDTDGAMTPEEDATYRRYQCEYAFFRSADAVVVEPHWAIAPKTMAVPLDYPAMWQRVEPMPLDGRPVAMLAPEDLLLVLCVHGSKHEWTQLRWISDVAELINRQPEPDLDETLRRARAGGSARMLLLGVGLARALFGVEVTAPVREALEADRPATSLVAEVVGRLFREGLVVRPPSRVTRFRLRMRERWRDRAAYVLRTVATPTVEYRRMVPLPPWLEGLYIPIRLLHDYAVLPGWLAAKRLARGGEPGARR